jgi:DcaP outer membrane protein
MKRLCLFLSILFIGTAISSPAQTTEEQQLKQRVQQLEQELADLKARVSAMPSIPAPAPATTTTVVTIQNESTEHTEEPAEESGLGKSTMQIYGIMQLDLGYDAGAVDPAWFDVVRTTKLPAFKDQFGKGGNTYAGVRQSRFGVKTFTPTKLGDLKTIFEFELFGVGVDAGQTTFRLRHAWGELGPIGAGQTWSPFMDPDVFPNSLEYWGPAGMVFFRNVQLRWTPYKRGSTDFAVALERPGASADPGSLAGREDIANTKGRFPAPDFSAHFRYGGERGHIQVATLVRYIKWDDLQPTPTTNNSGSAVGWGVNTSANYIFDKKNDTLRLQVVYGRGIQNYMNDSPVDVAAKPAFGDPRRTFDGEALTEVGVVAFLDHAWSQRWTSSIGYSLNDVGNTSLQAPSAFSKGQYALANFMFNPIKDVMTGAEFQWGRRENHGDGWKYDDYRVQFGFRYKFSFDIFGGGQQK